MAEHSLGHRAAMSGAVNATPDAVLPSVSGAIRLHGVGIAYDRRIALKDINGIFERGSLTAIAGPNGAGKSSLIRAIAGTLPLSAGRIDLGGLRKTDIGYLPQAADIDRSFPISVADTVLMGAWRRLGMLRGASTALLTEAEQALAAVGLGGYGKMAIGALSAGQFQRVLFARLLMQDAQLILLDEPFNAIDARTTEDLLKLVAAWHGEGRTVIAVLHDADQVRQHFPRTLLLARSPVAWGASSDVMSADNLRRAKMLADGWDRGTAGLL